MTIQLVRRRADLGERAESGKQEHGRGAYGALMILSRFLQRSAEVQVGAAQTRWDYGSKPMKHILASLAAGVVLSLAASAWAGNTSTNTSNNTSTNTSSDPWSSN